MRLIGNKDLYRGHVEAINHHFYINDVIEEAEDYIDLIDCLYQSRPTDTIYIHLNTRGGSLSITMQILNAIRASDATVVGIADGEVASAGSLILFECPVIGVQEFSYVMLHDGSEGLGGKTNENVKQALFSERLIKKIAYSCYKPFFTEEEIDEVLGGKDLWFTSDEIIERVTKYKENREQLEDEEDTE